MTTLNSAHNCHHGMGARQKDEGLLKGAHAEPRRVVSRRQSRVSSRRLSVLLATSALAFLLSFAAGAVDPSVAQSQPTLTIIASPTSVQVGSMVNINGTICPDPYAPSGITANITYTDQQSGEVMSSQGPVGNGVGFCAQGFYIDTFTPDSPGTWSAVAWASWLDSAGASHHIVSKAITISVSESGATSSTSTSPSSTTGASAYSITLAVSQGGTNATACWAPDPSVPTQGCMYAYPGGSVSTGIYAGAKVTLTAFPGAGYSFVGWAGTFNSTSNPLTITVPQSNVTETANLAPSAGTSNARTTGPTNPSSSTKSGGGVPEFPYQLLTVLTFTVLIPAYYALFRRQWAPGALPRRPA